MKRYLMLLGIGLLLVSAVRAEGIRDSLRNELSKAESSYDKGRLHAQIAYYVMGEDPSLAKKHLQEALLFSGEAKDLAYVGYSNFLMGQISRDQGEYKGAFHGYLSGVEAYQQIQYWDMVGRCYHALGQMHMIANQLEKASEYFKKAESFYKDIDGKDLGTFYLDLAGLYYEKGEIETARFYLTSSRDYLTSQYDKVLFSNWSGLLSSKEGNSQEAIEFFLEGVAYAEELNEISQNELLGLLYHNLGDEYKVIGDINQSQEAFRVSIFHKEAAGDFKSLMISFSKLGANYYELGQKEEALHWFDKAIGLGQEHNLGGNSESEFSYHQAIKLAGELGQYQKAYNYQQQYNQLLVSKRTNETHLAETKASLELQLAANERLSDKVAELHVQRMLWIGVSSALALVILAVVLGRVVLRHRQLKSKYTKKQKILKELKDLSLSPEF